MPYYHGGQISNQRLPIQRIYDIPSVGRLGDRRVIQGATYRNPLCFVSQSLSASQRKLPMMMQKDATIDQNTAYEDEPYVYECGIERTARYILSDGRSLKLR